MSRSTDPGHFFQTDASELTRARKLAKSGNKNGNPIVLQSKILTAIPDPSSSTSIYVAESTGCVRRINLETRDSRTVFRGPMAPVTSIAVGGTGGAVLFAGCWDKDIWSWNREIRALRRRHKGHSDFVKTILCAKVGDKDILISGGADSKIMIWDVATGERLHVLRDKGETMMGLQDLAIDPVDSTDFELVVVSSSSDPHIRRWRITVFDASQILNSDQGPSSESSVTKNTILQHETSVYKVLFTDDEEGDLWTASADGTAKCLSRAKNWSTEETYAHGDYVRAIAVTTDLVITAGRDEDVKIWDRATGKLRHVYEGHYEEVTGLVVLDGGRKVVSVSIDGTVRSWGLTEPDFEKARKEKEDQLKGVVKETKEQPKKSLLTEEEEAELADLMDSDEQ